MAAKKKIIVIKLGSAVLADASGKTDTKIIQKIANEIAKLHALYDIILVSSGAVSSGKHFLINYKGTLSERKAAAGIGNPLLINLYQKYFAKKKLNVAQALCERHHFSNRNQFLQMKNTFEVLWKNMVIPIVNENDLVSNHELKFSDNDELATLLAIGFNAVALLLCTGSNGLWDEGGKILPTVQKIDARVFGLIRKEKSAVGLGGMLSKITFAQLATGLGIAVYITGLKGSQPLHKTLALEKGTYCMPQQSTLKERQKWLMSGSVTMGAIYVDDGAAKALHARKSLLTIGIINTSGSFDAGQVVQVVDTAGVITGVAKTKLSHTEIIGQLKQKNIIAAHANDIVLF